MAKQNNDEFLRLNRLRILTILQWNTHDLLAFNHYFTHKFLMECIKNSKVCVKKTERKWIRCASSQTNAASVSVCVWVCLFAIENAYLALYRVACTLLRTDGLTNIRYHTALPLAPSLPSPPPLMALSQNTGILLVQEHTTSCSIHLFYI